MSPCAEFLNKVQTAGTFLNPLNPNRAQDLNNLRQQGQQLSNEKSILRGRRMGGDEIDLRSQYKAAMEQAPIVSFVCESFGVPLGVFLTSVCLLLLHFGF